MKNKNTKLLFLLLAIIAFTSCVSTKKTSITEAEILKPSEDHLVLMAPSNKKYTVLNYRFEEGKLFGELSKYQKRKGPKTYIHTDVNYDFNLSESEYLGFELKISDIRKITYQKPAPGKTVLLAITPLITIGVLFIVAIANWGM